MKTLFTFTILLFFNVGFVQSVLDNEIDDKIKMKLFGALLFDEGVHCGDSNSFDELVFCEKNVLENLVFNQTELYKGEFKNNKKGFHTFYSFRLYKIDSYLGMSQRYILHYKDIESEAWYRIMGFKENDFIHFYNTVLLKYFKKKEIIGIITDWQQQSKLLNEIDFECLIEGIKKNNTKNKCYISATLKFDRSLNSSDVDTRVQLSDNVYARFSRRPFCGTIPDISEKDIRKRYGKKFLR